MWSLWTRREGHGCVGPVLHQTGLSQVKSSPEATAWMHWMRLPRPSCSRCVPVVQDKARHTRSCRGFINGKGLKLLNRIFCIKAENIRKKKNRKKCVMYYSCRILLSFLITSPHRSCIHTDGYTAVFTKGEDTLLGPHQSTEHLTWWWNVMLVSDIHLLRGTHRCWNK